MPSLPHTLVYQIVTNRGENSLTPGTAQLTTAKAVCANISSNMKAVERIWRTPSGWKLHNYLYIIFVILPWSHICLIVLYKNFFIRLKLFICVFLSVLQPLCNCESALSQSFYDVLKLKTLGVVAVDCIALNYWGKCKRKMAIRSIN